VTWFNEVLTALLDAVQSVDALVRTLLAGFGMFLETSVLVGLVVPGDTIVIVASTAVDGPVEYFALVAAVIGLCTLVMVTTGIMLGRVLGALAGKRAEIIGGVILIAIGAVILYEHLSGAA